MNLAFFSWKKYKHQCVYTNFDPKKIKILTDYWLHYFKLKTNKLRFIKPLLQKKYIFIKHIIDYWYEIIICQFVLWFSYSKKLMINIIKIYNQTLFRKYNSRYIPFKTIFTLNIKNIDRSFSCKCVFCEQLQNCACFRCIKCIKFLC